MQGASWASWIHDGVPQALPWSRRMAQEALTQQGTERLRTALTTKGELTVGSGRLVTLLACQRRQVRRACWLLTLMRQAGGIAGRLTSRKTPSTRARDMHSATARAGLTTLRGFTLPLPTRSARTGLGAVTLAAVAMPADQHLRRATRAEEKASSAFSHEHSIEGERDRRAKPPPHQRIDAVPDQRSQRYVLMSCFLSA